MLILGPIANLFWLDDQLASDVFVDGMYVKVRCSLIDAVWRIHVLCSTVVMACRITFVNLIRHLEQ